MDKYKQADSSTLCRASFSGTTAIIHGARKELGCGSAINGGYPQSSREFLLPSSQALHCLIDILLE
jgi:hypothetical protein